MQRVQFYLGLAMQLFGFASVGICLFSGMQKGGYGRIELMQFVGGGLVFYIGTFLKHKSGADS